MKILNITPSSCEKIQTLLETERDFFLINKYDQPEIVNCRDEMHEILFE